MENIGHNNNQLQTIRMYIVNLKEQYGERNGSVVERFNIFSQCVICVALSWFWHSSISVKKTKKSAILNSLRAQ